MSKVGSGVLVGILITKLIETRGVKFGLTLNPKLDLNKRALVEQIYPYSMEKTYVSVSEADNKFREIVGKCKRGEFFYGNSVVEFKGEELKINQLIAVTVYLGLGIHSTSYERVSTLTEQKKYFEMCLSACSENIIDGYYRIQVYRDGKRVEIKYEKIQSSLHYLLKLGGKKRLGMVNKKSAKDTVENLFT